MATRFGRKWLRGLTLTYQVTVLPPARDNGAQARGLPNQTPPLFPFTDK